MTAEQPFNLLALLNPERERDFPSAQSYRDLARPEPALTQLRAELDSNVSRSLAAALPKGSIR